MLQYLLSVVNWTEKHHDFVLAVGTILLALFTAALFAATFWLVIFAWLQARDMRRLARATQRSAKAARQSANISQRVLAITQRPRIRIRHVRLDRIYSGENPHFEKGQPIYGRFDITNIGGSVANIVTWRCHLLFGRMENPPEWPTAVDPDPESDEFESVRPILDAGVSAELRFKSRYPLLETNHAQLTLLPQGFTMYAFGRITYVDENKVARTTGFCRCWAMPQGTNVARFYRIQNPDAPDFEYED